MFLVEVRPESGYGGSKMTPSPLDSNYTTELWHTAFSIVLTPHERRRRETRGGQQIPGERSEG